MVTKKTSSAVSVIRETDKYGERVVYVPIRSREGMWAILDAADFDRIERLGVSSRFFLSTSGSGLDYVRASAGGVTGNQLTVARFILGAQGGQIVQYHSSNRLDLRQRNISLAKGRATRDDCKLWSERNHDDFAVAAE